MFWTALTAHILQQIRSKVNLLEMEQAGCYQHVLATSPPDTLPRASFASWRTGRGGSRPV